MNVLKTLINKISKDNIKSNYMEQTRVVKQPDLGEIDRSILYFANSTVELII